MIALIAAVAANNIIGDSSSTTNGLPWHLPDELAYFRKVTKGATVVMGRTTLEAIGRALPKRRNIVLTRQPDYDCPIPGVEVCHSIDEMLSATMADENVFICGGAQLYAQALEQQIVDKLYITQVHAEVPGDTEFPPIALQEWHEVEKIHHPADVNHECAFTMYVYIKIWKWEKWENEKME